MRRVAGARSRGRTSSDRIADRQHDVPGDERCRSRFGDLLPLVAQRSSISSDFEIEWDRHCHERGIMHVASTAWTEESQSMTAVAQVPRKAAPSARALFVVIAE